MKPKTMTTLHFKKSIGRSLSWRCGLILVPLALVCFAFVQNTQAVNPPPDGGYPGANTAEGTDALFSLTSGIANTAVGQNALHDNTTGTHNTAVGRRALESLTDGSNNVSVGWRSGDNLATGSDNSFLGNQAGASYNGTESNNICIGNQTFGSVGESNAIRIGDA